MAEVKIVWSEESLNDIEEIGSFISKDSDYFAKNFVSKIVSAIDTLKVFPEIGRIVYKNNDKKIEILTVFHCSKLLE